MKLPAWVPIALKGAAEYRLPLSILGGLLVLSVFAFCRAKPNPVPQKEQHSLDSAQITKPIYLAARDTLIRTETTYVTKTVHDTAAARALYTSAGKAEARADSLQTLAQAADSNATLWHGVADARTQEASALHSVVDTLSEALLNEKAARVAADSRARLDSTRAVALDNLSQRLAADVKKAGECRVLLVLGCPSRKASFVAGALASIGVGAAIHFHKTIGF